MSKIPRNSLVIGGSNGIGISIVLQLAVYCERVAIIDKSAPDLKLPSNVEYRQIDLLHDDFSFLEQYKDIDCLVYTAGFGRVAPFESIVETEIHNLFQVNTIAAIKVLNYYFPRMKEPRPFSCAVMCSIAGFVSSPLFALYSASKAALCKAIEALNIELEMACTCNRILDVSPGSIKGTQFNGGENDLALTSGLAKEIIMRMQQSQTLFIPDYENIFKGVIERYRDNPHEFGIDSYNYKMGQGRFNLKPQVKIGYLSGTFDLFHVGHLNLIQRAKKYCDYLVVGVHPSAAHKGKETFIPFEERIRIVGNIKWVDRAILSMPEDYDVYRQGIVKYDFLFVGSDYKGTERFNRYEDYFADKGVKIIYFPYTKGTSSTQIRELILKKQTIK